MSPELAYCLANNETLGTMTCSGEVEAGKIPGACWSTRLAETSLSSVTVRNLRLVCFRKPINVIH